MIRVSPRKIKVQRLEKMLQRVFRYGMETPQSKRLLARSCQLIGEIGLSLNELFGCSVAGVEQDKRC